jgi:hypothetical protein
LRKTTTTTINSKNKTTRRFSAQKHKKTIENTIENTPRNMESHIYNTTQSTLENIPTHYKLATKHTTTPNITPRKKRMD